MALFDWNRNGKDMLSYNFNQKKEIGVKEIHMGDRMLVEAVV